MSINVAHAALLAVKAPSHKIIGLLKTSCNSVSKTVSDLQTKIPHEFPYLYFFAISGMSELPRVTSQPHHAYLVWNSVIQDEFCLLVINAWIFPKSVI